MATSIMAVLRMLYLQKSNGASKDRVSNGIRGVNMRYEGTRYILGLIIIVNIFTC